MQSVRSSKPSAQSLHNVYSSSQNLDYPFRLNLYHEPPRFDITLDDFEQCALDRLRILSEIESSMARNRTPEELQKVTKIHIDKYMELSSNTAVAKDLHDQRKKDHVSHFVLRLAFSTSEDLRRRFTKAETTLFRIKYQTDDAFERKAFLDSNDFGWIPVSAEEKERFASQLADAAQLSKEQVSKEEFCKVYWTRVPDLIERRKVFLKGGYAYVPSREQSSIVFQEFQTRLETALELTARSILRLDEDTRILPIIKHLADAFLSGVPSDFDGSTSEVQGEELRANMIDDMARRHFPLCMRNVHDHLRRDHHLKHQGRLQYGLFLKILGLPIEEALAFWRQSFSDITDDKFNKEYKYNVRHSFGLEGQRRNYPARTCQKILTQDQPGPQDCHGCPYKTFSPENLQSALLTTYGKQGLTMNDLPEIMNSVKSTHYHLACTRVFEITHKLKKGEGLEDGGSVDHPNHYAARSRQLLKDRNTEANDE